MKKSDRDIAVAILTEILDGGAYANIALRKTLAGTDRAPQSRAFITELVNETVRNLILIDHIIEAFSNTPAAEMKPFIRNVLRISVCQIRFLERIPERAAVDEAVKLTKIYGFERLSGFVNGILRNIAREPEKPAFSPKDIALRFSYPPWLVNSLVKWLGGKGAIAFCENSHKPAPLTILVNTLKTDAAHVTQMLEADGVEVSPVENENAQKFPMLALRHTGDISKLKAFNEGLFIVTDPGAMAAVAALDAQPGQTILDLCAAPGGKSFAAAFQMENRGQLLSFDIHAHKIGLLKQTQKRLGLSVIKTGVHDAQIFSPSLANQADAVLLDAPCSGLGTIRKHPEIKYTRTPDDIKFLAKKQAVMLETAAKYVKAGGVLVYCTCTVATEENMEIINRFVEANPEFSVQSANQTLPCAASDAFFTAKLIREQ
ncbi:MAG: 16S rRNA (cytosine(967)-C(5))-methyltransferase RsmB [Defluviitaleaceae bacterium]|nr:16S rRNA (cytosine(967)-C(5))-methyltransferase RsmB [Defluviitaleaceae bacterium]MCL2263585.1 16S rRNA (cytosine(967)-C(5))-methyltransferase RsmB [Defluviitaleaceae bacterium]